MKFKNIKILVVDDDPTLSESVALLFAEAGAQVLTASNGREGLHQLHALMPDIVILDVMMPEMNGWEMCRQARQVTNVPILMMTTLAEDQDVVRGLEYGADDYIAKPFSPEVLMARVAAVLRRASVSKEDSPPAHQFDDGYLAIDLKERLVTVAGQSVSLSATEFKLLALFVQQSNRLLSYQQILLNVWGSDYRDRTDYVHVYVSHLRRKLERDSRNPHYLRTVSGIGYRFHA